MKPKMKDNTQNELALINMIGQGQDMWDFVEVTHIAAWAGVSKTTILNRLWRLVNGGYLNIYATEQKNGALKYAVGLTVSGQEWAFSGAAKREYNRWKSCAQHVREIRIGSQKSMFI